MKFIIIGIAILVIVGGSALYFQSGGEEVSESTTSMEDGTVDTSTSNASDKKIKQHKIFTLDFKDYDGNDVKLTDFSGKNLIVNSWAVWCPFCINELPTFAELQEEFKEDVVLIAIDRAESLSKAKKYSDDLGVTDSFIFWLDSSDSFYRSIGGFSMPETVFVSPQGEIVFHKRGPMKLDEMRRLTKESFNL